MLTRKPRAIVVGGSLGGLFAATMLPQVCGWDVYVYERVDGDAAFVARPTRFSAKSARRSLTFPNLPG